MSEKGPQTNVFGGAPTTVERRSPVHQTTCGGRQHCQRREVTTCIKRRANPESYVKKSRNQNTNPAKKRQQRATASHTKEKKEEQGKKPPAPVWLLLLAPSSRLAFFPTSQIEPPIDRSSDRSINQSSESAKVCGVHLNTCVLLLCAHTASANGAFFGLPSFAPFSFAALKAAWPFCCCARRTTNQHHRRHASRSSVGQCIERTAKSIGVSAAGALGSRGVDASRDRGRIAQEILGEGVSAPSQAQTHPTPTRTHTHTQRGASQGHCSPCRRRQWTWTRPTRRGE